MHSPDGVDERSGEETPIKDQAERSSKGLFPSNGEHADDVLNFVCYTVTDAAARVVFKAKQRCHVRRYIDQGIETGQNRDTMLSPTVNRLLTGRGRSRRDLDG